MKSIKLIVSILSVLCFFSVAVMSAYAGESTLPDNSICPVHGIKMQRVKLRVVYGMPSKLEFEEMRVGRSLFPHGRDYVLAGCVVKPEKFRISRASQASLEEFFTIMNSRDVDEAMKMCAHL